MKNNLSSQFLMKLNHKHCYKNIRWYTLIKNKKLLLDLELKTLLDENFQLRNIFSNSNVMFLTQKRRANVINSMYNYYW